MANTTGQGHALVDYYGQYDRPLEWNALIDCFMANNVAGQWHALIAYYGQYHRPLEWNALIECFMANNATGVP